VCRTAAAAAAAAVCVCDAGKFLPFVEQRIEDNVAHRHKKQ
jgi:hypothetical protein